jgi:hypothetical protein
VEIQRFAWTLRIPVAKRLVRDEPIFDTRWRATHGRVKDGGCEEA